MKRAGLAAAVLVMAVALMGAGPVDQVSDIYLQKYMEGQTVPLASSIIPGLDEAGAYEVQGLYVAKLLQAGDSMLGYKGGLTSAPAQKKFNAPGPATGVLLGTMLVKDGVVKGDKHSKMMLEVEIGYRLAADVKGDVNADTVKKYVGTVMPAVEVPDLNFATFKGLTFVDIVADNVGARNVILGKEMPVGSMDVNAVTGQLMMNGKALADPVPGRAALGDQWKALAWILNNVRKNGGSPKKGEVIITGSLGRMYPGKPGSYEVAYTGGLGGIVFTVK